MDIIERIRQNRHAYGYRGLLFAAKSRILPPLSKVKVNPPAFAKPVYMRTKSSDIPTYHQVFLGSEYDVDVAKVPGTIIDAGANVGFTSLFFAHKYPTARIFAIEPETSNFKLLKKNVAPYKNIIPIQAALWNLNTQIIISDPGSGKWGFQTRSPSENNSGATVERVAGKTLDSLMKEYAIDAVDILKVDIEGAERRVFEDASNWIDKIGVLMIELHDQIAPLCTETVLNATAHFEYEYTRNETFFLARQNYIPGKSLSTVWQKRRHS